MPYSITTRDGITLQGIPDDMPADHPDLKARVAAIRGQGKPVEATEQVTSAPSSGVLMGLRDPVDAGAQLLRRAMPEFIAKPIDTFGNWLADKGLVAKSNGVEGVDNIVKDVNAGYEATRKADGGSGFDGARILGNVANPASWYGGGIAKGGNLVRQLMIGGAKAGAVSGALQPVLDTENFWTEKGKQTAGGAAAGAVATPIIAKGAEAIVKGAGAVGRALTPRTPPSDQQITIAINNTLASQGMKAGEIPDSILKSVAQQVSEALNAGRRIDPAAMIRKAQFEAVGLTGDAAPTLGQATRDPMQFANEKNLSGVRLDRGARGHGNDLADRFQAQNNQLGRVFDLAGATGATDRVTAGQTIIDALKASDAPVKGGVDAAYTAAREMTGGRAADLERGTFSQAANDALDKGMWGRFVPENIRGLLNDITSGKTPFNVDAAVQIDGILSAAQRRAGQGSPEASAIGVIRDALHATPMAKPGAPMNNAAEDLARQAARTVDEGVTDVAPKMQPGSPALPSGQPALPGPAGAQQAAGAITDIKPATVPPAGGAAAMDEGAAARAAFDEARAAARKRFATIEDTPALKAALEGEAPDNFVRKYILGGTAADVAALKKILANSPEALDQARAQIAAHLKAAAFGANQSGDGGFAAAKYANTLQAIGKQKLEAFFTPAEVVRLNLVGKVASDINSIPAGAKYGTNTSGTGAAVMNLLAKLGGNKMVANVPVVGQIAGALADKAGAMATQSQINTALKAVPAAQSTAASVSPEIKELIRSLLPAAGVTAGAAAAPVNATPDDAPAGLPPGSRKVGTSKGKPVYETPTGKRYVME